MSGANATRVISCLDAAIAYADRGWAVLPVYKGQKNPLTAHGFKDASRDKNIISQWWERWPSANVAIVTGAISGIVVLDVDPRHGGDASLAKLQQEYGQLPETIESITGGGGSHYVFAHPGEEVKSRSNIRPGLDIKGDNGYIVAPPSIHESGNRYEWRENRAPEAIIPAPLPEWLKELVIENTSELYRADRECSVNISLGSAKISNKNTHDCLNSSIALLLCKPEVTDAIRITLPDKGGVRNKSIFNFVRRLKAIPEIANQKPGELIKLAREWHKQALPKISTKDFAETWGDFLAAWNNVKLPHGVGIDRIFKQAKLSETFLPENVRALGTRAILLAQVCLILGEGGNVFPLSCRIAAKQLSQVGINTSHTEANLALRNLLVLDFIKIVMRGDTRRANRYRLGITSEKGENDL